MFPSHLLDKINIWKPVPGVKQPNGKISHPSWLAVVSRELFYLDGANPFLTER